MHSHFQPVTSDDCEDLKIESYSDFITLILPKNKDFTDLVINRQLDRDLMESQNNYIEKIETIDFTPKKITISDGYQEDVLKLLAVTLSMIVLNKFRNKEILRTFKANSKNQYTVPIEQMFDGKEVLQAKTVIQFIGLKGK